MTTAGRGDGPVMPWWVRSSGWVIRRLPAGRFRVAALVAKRTAAPFVAQMAREHGGARFWCDLDADLAVLVCGIRDSGGGMRDAGFGIIAHG